MQEAKILMMICLLDYGAGIKLEKLLNESHSSSGLSTLFCIQKLIPTTGLVQ